MNEFYSSVVHLCYREDRRAERTKIVRERSPSPDDKFFGSFLLLAALFLAVSHVSRAGKLPVKKD
jgi:hypothetical protein